MNFAKCWATLFPVTHTCLFCPTPMEVHPFASVWRQICFVCDKQLSRIRFNTCYVCGRLTNQEKRNICSDCEAVHPAEWVINRSVFTYSEFVKQIIWRYKYRGQQQLAKAFGLLMADVIDQCWQTKSFVISYVPLHQQRLKERGFNQAELLAKAIGKRLRLPVIELLKRQRMTQKQSTKGRNERLSTLKGAFCLKQEIDVSKLAQHHILLVDDIYTTGTTLRECAKPLKEQGIENVYSITIAR